MKKIYLSIVICILLAGVVQADISQCERSTSKDRCIMDHASTLADCSEIFSSITKEKCIDSQVNQESDPDECVKGSYADEYCVAQVIQQNPNVKINACNDVFNTNECITLASENLDLNDLDQCHFLDEKTNECEVIIFRNHIPRSEQCNAYQDQRLENCIFATYNKYPEDISACKTFSSEEYQERCAYDSLSEKYGGDVAESLDCSSYEGAILKGCQEYQENPPALIFKKGVGLAAAFAGGFFLFVLGVLSSIVTLVIYFMLIIAGAIILKQGGMKKERVLNFFLLPGLGTLQQGSKGIGLTQIILFAIGIVLCCTMVLGFIGVPLVIIAYIWSALSTRGM